ncbi:CHASE domain-containing protein [Erythrobacter sp. YT30]|uniref:CHASE domain-containing protein n=1 Tax=Erythrobacter sp. YT30 TaxID=1735012 RepID=UPI0009E6E786|nr:CHASE domain-containing protein [Erythrobacter sp. YT30]
MGEVLNSATGEKLSAETVNGPKTATNRTRRWLIEYPRAIPLAIFAAVAAITALSVFAVESNARAREQAQLEAYGQAIESALERRGSSFSSYLRAGAALLTSREDITPQDFQQFVAELRLDLTYQGAEGIGWAELIEPEDVPAFRERIEAYQPDFPGVHPYSDDNETALAPVTYFSRNSGSSPQKLGFDLYSDPVRAAAMEEALLTVLPTASGRISLAQTKTKSAPGFVIFMPVYRPVPGGAGNDRELAGFVFSPFHAGRFLDAAIEVASPEKYGVRLYDGSKDTRHLLVARSLDDSVSDQFESPVTIANRQLQLVIESRRSLVLAPLSMLTLLFGLSVAGLLMLLARLLTQQAYEDQSRLAFFEEQYSIRATLTRELNHRVKNTLANVLSILSLTRRRASDLDQFADSFEGRIRALSATHDLLTSTDWGTTPIASVVDAELGQFSAATDHDVRLEGPDVELAPNDALSFGLAVHELATNAAKYGALSVPNGSVAVKWSLISDDLAEVEWIERNGPPVSENRGRGFGTDLIEKIIAHELKNPVDLTFAKEGVRCVMRVPVRQRGEFKIRAMD